MARCPWVGQSYILPAEVSEQIQKLTQERDDALAALSHAEQDLAQALEARRRDTDKFDKLVIAILRLLYTYEPPSKPWQTDLFAWEAAVGEARKVIQDLEDPPNSSAEVS